MKKQPRKTRRQLQAEKLAAAQKVVDQANTIEDPLKPLEKFHSYELPDKTQLGLEYCIVENLTEEQSSWIFDLMERNMEDMYKKSSWGWDREKKREELNEYGARYLIASKGETKIGFSHFRFDLDDGVDVLYCYELQLEENFRRKGIGKFMMKALEAIGQRCGVQKIVLTVFKNNASAMSFFTSLGFRPDITNPSESHKMDYVILSKRC